MGIYRPLTRSTRPIPLAYNSFNVTKVILEWLDLSNFYAQPWSAFGLGGSCAVTFCLFPLVVPSLSMLIMFIPDLES